MDTTRGLALLLALVTVTAPVAGAAGGSGTAHEATDRAGQATVAALAAVAAADGPSTDGERVRVKIEPATAAVGAYTRAAVDVRHDFGRVVTTDLTQTQFERLRAAPGLAVSRVQRVRLAHHKPGHGDANEVTVSWRAPSDGATVAGSTAIEVAASTTKSKIDRVEWRVDGGTWRSASQQGGTWVATWDSTAVADGEHTLTARATNKRGVTDTASVTVTTDNANASPTAAWLTPSNGATVGGTVELAVDADDPDGSVQAVTWQVDDGASRQLTHNATSGAWEGTWDSTTVADGTHTLSATVTDDQGATDTTAITVTTDNVNEAPAVAWVEPRDGDTVQGTVPIRLDAADPDGSVGKVTWRVEGGSARTATLNATSGYYEATWNTSGLPGGDYNLSATVTDDEGASGTAAITTTVATSNDPPTVTVLSPSDGATVADTVLVRVDATDADGSLSNVTWQVGGVTHQATYNATADVWEDTWDTTTVADGNYTLSATATDDEGATATASVAVAVDNTDFAPAVYWHAPAEGEVVAGTTALELVTEDDGTVTAVDWRVDGGTWQSANLTSSGTWADTWDTTTVADGAHTLSARAVDDTGQTARAVVNVTVDNGGGGVETAWLRPVEGASLRGEQAVRIDVNATDDVESVEWRVDDGAARAATYNATTGTWEATWDTGTTWAGAHNLTAVATTVAGDVDAATVTVTIEPQPSDQTPYGVEQLYDDPTIARTSGGDGVDVAVLDTGVDRDHPDLRNALERCVDAIGVGTCEDGHGHGTHVAGTVLADAGSDGAGIYGVAPGADLHAYKVLDDSGYGYADDIAAAIHDAAANDVEVVSMSLGASTESSLIAEEIAAHRDQLVVVAAAGNSGPSLDTIEYPGANNASIAVAAIDETRAVTSFSSRGLNASAFCACDRYVEVAAAGASVESTAAGGGYTTMSGTSMATPHVSGFAAKVWASGAADLDGDGTVTPAEVREYVRSRAVDVTDGRHARTGYDPAAGVGLPVLP